MSTPKQQVKRQILEGLRARINGWSAEREKIVMALARRDEKTQRLQKLNGLIAEAQAQVTKLESDNAS